MFAHLQAVALGLLLLRVVTVFDSAAAQATSAVCLSNFSWMFNSLDQSPCVVASYVEGACVDTEFNIAALPAGRHYVGPLDPSQANACICSSVAYNLVSACGICQGSSETEKWSAWMFNCTPPSLVTSDGYGHAVPADTAIPAWAFQAVVQSDLFNAQEAMTVAGENLPDTLPTSSGSGSSGSPSSSGSSSSSSGSSSPNIGAIVGGVVGGVIVLGLIIALIVYFAIRRKRSQSAPSSAYTNNHTTPIPEKESLYPPSPAPYAQAPYGLTGSPAPYGLTGSPAPPSAAGFGYGPQTDYSGTPQPRLYDPNDPSTFPQHQFAAGGGVHSPQPQQLGASPAPTTPYGYGPQYSATPVSHAQTHMGGGAGYSGVPEI